MLSLIGLALALGELIHKNQSKQDPIKRSEQEQPPNNHQTIPTNQSSEPALVNPSIGKPSSQDEEWRNEEKRYWKSQICLGKWLNLITGIGAAIAALALYVVYLQVDSAHIAAEASRTSADVAKATLVATQRPWISVNVEIAGDWEYGSNIKAKYTMNNYGPTPAVEVYFMPGIVLWEPGGEEGPLLANRQREMCEYAKREMGFGNPMIVPHQEWIETREIGLGKEFIQKHLKENTPRGIPPVFINPFILGCVTYRFTFDNSVHQTPYAFSMARRDTKNPSNLLGMRIDIGPIPANRLALTPVILKGGAVPD
jgi:hypothetical protein